MRDTITTQRALRAEFWREHKGCPGVTPRRIRDYAGTGKMHTTDTRAAWVDYIDSLSRDGRISQALARRATL